MHGCAFCAGFFHGANTAILALANQLKEGTIEKVLGKSDLELGLEALGQMKF